MFILMLMVIYGIIGELSSPGAICGHCRGDCIDPGALHVGHPAGQRHRTGVDRAGDCVVHHDVFATTHGVLTAGGILSFFLGALMLFSNAGPGFGLSLGWIIPGTVVTAAVFHLCRRQGHPRAVQTDPRRRGNDARQNGERAFAD